MSNELVGQYVRMVIAPNTRMGWIKDMRIGNGNVEFLFSHDQKV